MMSYLFTIEAPDASGKTTQIDMLCRRLIQEGYKVKQVRFPNYGSDACKPAELYLNGALGSKLEDTNAYAASVFFAVDRYFSYHTDWRTDYQSPDTIILLDRYTTSNAIHQLSKITEPKEKDAFLEWLYDFEFGKLQLPVPNDTVFLDVVPEVSLALLKKRAGEQKDRTTDIHEANTKYLQDCYKAGLFAAQKKGWHKITCTENQQMRSAIDIHHDIYAFVKSRVVQFLQE